MGKRAIDLLQMGRELRNGEREEEGEGKRMKKIHLVTLEAPKHSMETLLQTNRRENLKASKNLHLF